MPENRIIFLDIDGVICTARTTAADPRKRWRILDPIAIGMVERLAEKFDMEVVVSSTWRHFIDVPLLFSTHGSTLKFHDDYNTYMEQDNWGAIIQGVQRGGEIQKWIDRNGEPDVMLILDDEESNIRELFEGFFVQTDAEEGFLWKHFQEAEEILEKQIA